MFSNRIVLWNNSQIIDKREELEILKAISFAEIFNDVIFKQFKPIFWPAQTIKAESVMETGQSLYLN